MSSAVAALSMLVLTATASGCAGKSHTPVAAAQAVARTAPKAAPAMPLGQCFDEPAAPVAPVAPVVDERPGGSCTDPGR